LKHSPLEELVSPLASWFNQAHKSNASIDSTHFKEKTLHITACLGIANFLASSGWVNRFNKSTTLFTELYQLRAGVLTQKTGKIIHYCKKLKVIYEYDLCADMTGLFSIYSLAKHSLFKQILVMVVQNLNSRLLCSPMQCRW
jgi:hypothetical protein